MAGATSVVHVNSTPLQAPMCRMLLILLYGSGLRIGEALNLTLRDVDAIERILTVRDAKFFKTRLVPIGPKLAGQLAVHIQRGGGNFPCRWATILVSLQRRRAGAGLIRM